MDIGDACFFLCFMRTCPVLPMERALRLVTCGKGLVGVWEVLVSSPELLGWGKEKGEDFFFFSYLKGSMQRTNFRRELA